MDLSQPDLRATGCAGSIDTAAAASTCQYMSTAILPLLHLFASPHQLTRQAFRTGNPPTAEGGRSKDAKAGRPDRRYRSLAQAQTINCKLPAVKVVATLSRTPPNLRGRALTTWNWPRNAASSMVYSSFLHTATAVGAPETFSERLELSALMLTSLLDSCNGGGSRRGSTQTRGTMHAYVRPSEPSVLECLFVYLYPSTH